MLVALKEGLRDGERLLAFLALLLEMAFLGLAFLALVRVPMVFLAERRRAGFSGVVSGAGTVADIVLPRPSPRLLASWDRRSE